MASGIVANPFLALSFIAGPAILTNASAVLLNSASIRYNLAIGLWRDLQADLRGLSGLAAAPYVDRRSALRLAGHRVRVIVQGLNLLYGAVGGFGLSALIGLAGAIGAETRGGGWVDAAKVGTVVAAAFGLVSLLAAVTLFVAESAVTTRLMRLSLPPEEAASDPSTAI